MLIRPNLGKGQKIGGEPFQKRRAALLALFEHGQLVEAVADLVCQTASGQILTGKRTQRAIAKECRASIVRCDLVVPGDSGGYGRQKRGEKARERASAPFSILSVMPGRACVS